MSNRHLLRLYCLLLSLFTPLSHADLLVSPIRVLLDERNRTAEITLLNTSSVKRSYRLNWVDKRQQVAGDYIDVDKDDPGFSSASKAIRFSPRQVTILPGERQRVRLKMHRRSTMEQGEYHTHLLFKQLASSISPPKSSKQAQAEGMQLTLQSNISIAIPVVLRLGREGSVSSKITDLSFEKMAGEKSQLMLNVELNRTGEYSTLGTVRVSLEQKDRKPEQIGILKNVALYTEVNRRTVAVPLRVQHIPPGAKIRVSYTGDEEFSGRVWDRASFRYNP